MLFIALCLMSGMLLPAYAEPETRVISDCLGREVEVPASVERIVCTGVGALRYVCYLGAQDLVVGVEEHETEAVLQRLYTYVNHEQFSQLPIIGTEPALKPAVERHPGGRILVMATAMTVKEQTFQALRAQ